MCLQSYQILGSISENWTVHEQNLWNPAVKLIFFLLSHHLYMSKITGHSQRLQYCLQNSFLKQVSATLNLADASNLHTAMHFALF